VPATRSSARPTGPPPRAGHFVRRVVLDAPAEDEADRYPFNLPLVRSIQTAGGFDLSPGVTAIAGENGSGKSTLVEAIAVALGLNPEGGSRSLRFSTRATESDLGRYARAVRAPGRERRSFFLRAESFYNVATQIEEVDGGSSEILAAYGGKSLHTRSHGESFIDLLRHRFGPAGLYLLDEPEAALSVQGCLAALALIDHYVNAGAQFIIATHSPILLALPRATIIQIEDDGSFHHSDYDACRTVSAMRAFLDSPQRALRYLLADDE
jgi:predicted ATPase